MSVSGAEDETEPKASRFFLNNGERALLGILISDFFVAVAGTIVYLTMVWWVLDQGASELGVTLLVLAIFIPMNLGVIVSGVAVAKYGARRLLLISKAMALIGAILCYALLATEVMTLWLLALLAVFVYGSMGPSDTADISRAPALARLARRRLATFNAANGIAVLIGAVAGLSLGGYLSDERGSATAIAVGAVMVAISLAVTFFTFPRDRVRTDFPSSNREHWVKLTRSVIKRFDGKTLSLITLLVTIGLITVSEAFVEVLLPLALRVSDLPPTELSKALVMSTVGGVIAYLAAERIHGKIKDETALLLSFVVLSTIVIIAFWVGGWHAKVIAMLAATALASFTAMLVFTTMQLRMPTSLQAQAASLWNSAELALSAAVMFLTGLVGTYGFLLLVVITLVCSFVMVVSTSRSRIVADVL